MSKKFILLFLINFFMGTTIFADLTLYSYRQEYLIKPILDQFTEKTGIKVNILFAKKGLVERIKNEKQKTLADGILTTSVTELVVLEKVGLLSAIDRRKNIDAIAPSFKSSENLWIGLSKRARIIFASKERVSKGQINDYEQLADSQWEGKICTRSGKQNYNVALFSSLYEHHGKEKTKEFLQNLKNNLARKPKGNDRAQVVAIASGICDLSIGNSYYYGVMLNHKDEAQRKAAKKVFLIFPNQKNRGTHINISGIAIIKHSKKKNEMNQLIDFLTSDKAQKLYADLNYEFPIRDDIKVSAIFEKYRDQNRFDQLPVKNIYKNLRETTVILDEIQYDF